MAPFLGRLKVDLEKVLRDTFVQPGSGGLQLATKSIEHSPFDFEVRSRDMPKPVGARIVGIPDLHIQVR